ncbi:hypothetical protein KJ359_011509 [Pestalotiopsis sp. 9143b]|nr:hypothetical protein KJ359_011509 [Pestalotiopsis sp. 9143b]
MSSIHIDSNDELYYYLMKWLAQQLCLTSSRSLMAETVSRTVWEDENATVTSPEKSGIYLNFANQEATTQVAQRPVRDTDTVVLDNEQKLRILEDINEYIKPKTSRWYASRGIPLRRGYLFYGPPGTGKTSLAFALAGVFGLELYVISLLEPSLTEEDLLALFSCLPRRCIVLLEDIDTAGLKRTTKQFNTNRFDREKAEMVDVERGGISLSGLLNSIDGVASHEGRVLIMTTNHLDSLDDALIRPGRVDLQVEFTNATHTQVEELFQRMYKPDPEKDDAAADAPVTSSTPTCGMPHGPIQELAKRFADKVPAGQLSPAEVQGYLLKHKTDPLRAVDEAERWLKSTI